MSLLAELEDISACAAWSPLKEYGDYVVTGTKVRREEEERRRRGNGSLSDVPWLMTVFFPF